MHATTSIFVIHFVGARNHGFTLIELLVVVAIILVLLAIAIPNIKTAQLVTKETAVAKEVQTINQAQIQYMTQYGQYASALAELGPPSGASGGREAAQLIPGSLASGEKNGYQFIVTRTASGYSINANPRVFNSTGRRTFYSDETNIIRQHWGPEPAGPQSEELK